MKGTLTLIFCILSRLDKRLLSRRWVFVLQELFLFVKPHLVNRLTALGQVVQNSLTLLQVKVLYLCHCQEKDQQITAACELLIGIYSVFVCQPCLCP